MRWTMNSFTPGLTRITYRATSLKKIDDRDPLGRPGESWQTNRLHSPSRRSPTRARQIDPKCDNGYRSLFALRAKRQVGPRRLNMRHARRLVSHERQDETRKTVEATLRGRG